MKYLIDGGRPQTDQIKGPGVVQKEKETEIKKIETLKSHERTTTIRLLLLCPRKLVSQDQS